MSQKRNLFVVFVFPLNRMSFFGFGISYQFSLASFSWKRSRFKTLRDTPLTSIYGSTSSGTRSILAVTFKHTSYDLAPFQSLFSLVFWHPRYYWLASWLLTCHTHSHARMLTCFEFFPVAGKKDWKIDCPQSTCGTITELGWILTNIVWNKLTYNISIIL